MWFRVAALFGCPVSEAQARMSSIEFTYWCEFYRKEPWGYEMENWRAGLISSTVANVAPRKRGARSLKPQDFYPANAKRQPDITPELKAEIKRRFDNKKTRKNRRGKKR